MRGIARAAALAATMTAAVLTAAAMTAAASAAQAGPAFAGREVFKISTVKPGPRHATVTAHGAFRARGHFIRKHAALVFPRGRIIVRRHVLHTSYPRPDLATCRFKIFQNGTFAVTRGTGKFRGIHGDGTFRTTVQGRLRRTGHDRCGTTIVTYRAVTYETGTVR